MTEPKLFAPLMTAINDVLEALGDRTALQQPLRDKADELHAKYVEYEDCCCFFANVIPFDPLSKLAPRKPRAKKAKAKKAKAKKAKAKKSR
jgi:hypothetical protein